MITRVSGATGERIFDGEIGRFVEASAIPCHRCGVCCEQWQPLISPVESERLAAHLGVSFVAFLEQYTTPYPFDDAARLLRRGERGCVFLAYDASGRSRCTVHPARPDACRDWLASLDRRECVSGLRRFGDPDRALPLTVVYPDEADRCAFTDVIRPAGATAEAGNDA